ncbi:preprotein translocase subunit SecE [Peptococcus simiae]|uniref:Protein translocase subunit SecE n=1 Tax=Peptococcus simiae TaxID=1643805 RepID=A0ABW9GWD2_9FIRM
MSRQKGTEKKEGFFTRVKKNFRLSFSELKKVHWPNRQETITYTGVVLVTVAIITTLIWVVDSGITAALGLLL